MKTYLFSISFFLLNLFYSSSVHAQLPAIDSLKIIPSNPTAADSVKIISDATFPSGGCSLTNSSVSISSNIITVSAIHMLGMAAFICHSTDTLNLGLLNAGIYELRYVLYDTLPPITHDIDTIFFTVQGPSNLVDEQYANLDLSIYPNPVHEDFCIDLKNSKGKKFDVEIYSVLNQKVKTIKQRVGPLQIDSKDLPEGFYLITVTDENKKRWSGKFIKAKQ